MADIVKIWRESESLQRMSCNQWWECLCVEKNNRIVHCTNKNYLQGLVLTATVQIKESVRTSVSFFTHFKTQKEYIQDTNISLIIFSIIHVREKNVIFFGSVNLPRALLEKYFKL